jgi:hypothetical protein
LVDSYERMEAVGTGCSKVEPEINLGVGANSGGHTESL